DGSFFRIPELVQAMQYVKQHNSILHFMGLVSDGGVHSTETHYLALLEMAKQQGLAREQVMFHAALDGRDTPPTSGAGYLERLVKQMDKIGIGKVATISGRYYLMDRDKRWERLQKSYDALTMGEGVTETDPVAAVKVAYVRGETDEFIKPIVITNTKRIKDNDSVIFFNFRADRAREITRTLTAPNFADFARKSFPKVFYTAMTQYDEKFTLPVAFKPVHLNNILAQVLADNKITQLRISDTEKYAHVTYFFNGGQEKPYPYEERIHISSPKVPTYDIQPEMSAPAVTREVLKAIESDKYTVIIMNYANCDMVGHTGVLAAAIKAAETVDNCVAQIVSAVLKQSGVVLVTADHGNAEEMIDAKNGGPHTYHTTNPVPFTLVSEQYKKRKLRTGGRLCDVAPTILEILGISKPKEMEGVSLII
ncbi:MAG: 2,3-bisphosphoglycerate-independent phosphoglycerate mutase, partial [Planctomycetes bacterium]|nr:2,3-bisphosphoglycerate-independent phosphoglycerate mutase [Planctomycetota bacterium]